MHNLTLYLLVLLLQLSSFNELWSVVGAWVSYRTIDWLVLEDEEAAAAALKAARRCVRALSRARQAYAACVYLGCLTLVCPSRLLGL